MGRFSNLFKRREYDHQAAQRSRIADADLPGANVAHLKVAGMHRTNQGTYITSYSSTKPEFSQQSTTDAGLASCSSSTTAVSSGEVSTDFETSWKGQPNGKSYDKRTELTEEDEDAWTRMAM